MPIADTDIKTRLSIKTGTAGNQSPQSDPNASLGKYISTTNWTGGVIHDLFDKITGDENAALTADYRCIFLYNSHATLTWENVYGWISAETAGGASIAIGVDATAASAIGSSSAQATFIANETAVPSGVAFTSPTSKGSGIAIGNIAAGSCRAIWIRRTALNTGAVNSDSVTLSFEGDTAA